MDVPMGVVDSRVCPFCGYKLGGLTGEVCPECGKSVTPWTTRWRPWQVRTGLTMVCWGTMSVMGAFVVVATIRMLRSQSPWYLLMDTHTFLVEVVPAVIAFTGCALVSSARQHGGRTAWLVSGAGVCFCLLAARGTREVWVQRQPTGVTVLGGWSYFVWAFLTFACGVVAASLVARAMTALGREFGQRVGGAVALGVGLLAMALFAGGTTEAFQEASAVLTPAPGSPGNFNRTQSFDSNAYRTYIQAAAGLGLSIVFIVAVFLRSRVQWELASRSRG